MRYLSFDRNTKLFTYQYKDKNIIFDNFEHLYWMKDTVIQYEKIKWNIDDTNNLLYCLDEKMNKIYLIEKILNSSIDNKEIIFIDNNRYNYCSSNIKIIDKINVKNSKNIGLKKIESINYINNFENFQNNIDITKSIEQEKTNNDDVINNEPENFPNNYNIIKCFEGHTIFAGKKSGQTFNPYWLVYDKNDINKTKLFLMSCNDNKCYFIFSMKSIDYVKDRTWFLSENGYITTVEKNANNKRFQYYLHQLICKTENGDESETKSVDHINRNKLDNRIENLRWATQAEQNANTDKRARKYNAKPLPEGLMQSDMPKYVTYYHEWLDKEKTRYREFFKIEKHPKQEKIWNSSKSNKISIKDKLKEAIDKLAEFNN